MPDYIAINQPTRLPDCYCRQEPHFANLARLRKYLADDEVASRLNLLVESFTRIAHSLDGIFQGWNAVFRSNSTSLVLQNCRALLWLCAVTLPQFLPASVAAQDAQWIWSAEYPADRAPSVKFYFADPSNSHRSNKPRSVLQPTMPTNSLSTVAR